MRAFRLCRSSYPAYDGEGARRVGGRWNSRGVRVLYMSENRSLAVLEFSVATFACKAVPAIQGKCHFFPPSFHTLARYCTPERRYVCKLLILLWRREWDSNPR